MISELIRAMYYALHFVALTFAFSYVYAEWSGVHQGIWMRILAYVCIMFCLVNNLVVVCGKEEKYDGKSK